MDNLIPKEMLKNDIPGWMLEQLPAGITQKAADHMYFITELAKLSRSEYKEDSLNFLKASFFINNHLSNYVKISDSKKDLIFRKRTALSINTFKTYRKNSTNSYLRLEVSLTSPDTLGRALNHKYLPPCIVTKNFETVENATLAIAKILADNYNEDFSKKEPTLSTVFTENMTDIIRVSHLAPVHKPKYRKYPKIMAQPTVKYLHKETLEEVEYTPNP